jgi:hypothetical protein
VSLSPPAWPLAEFRTLKIVDAVWRIERLFGVIFCSDALTYPATGCRKSVLVCMASRVFTRSKADQTDASLIYFNVGHVRDTISDCPRCDDMNARLGDIDRFASLADMVDNVQKTG